MRRIVVTGTDTDVGKTYYVARLAAALLAGGQSVRVVKPVQCGAPGDAAEVNRLVGAEVAEEWQFMESALAPESAARIEGKPLLRATELVTRLSSLTDDVVIVEGAGGVLVRIDLDGATIADLAEQWGADVIVVTRDALGTLNHTGLTVEHLRARGIEPVLVIGMSAGDAAALVQQAELERVTGCRIVDVVPLETP